MQPIIKNSNYNALNEMHFVWAPLQQSVFYKQLRFINISAVKTTFSFLLICMRNLCRHISRNEKKFISIPNPIVSCSVFLPLVVGMVFIGDTVGFVIL